MSLFNRNKNKRGQNIKLLKRPQPKRTFSRPHVNFKLNSLSMRLIYISAALLIFGLLMIYSASAVLAYSEGESTFHFFLLQLVWIGIGLALGFVAYKMPLAMVSKASVIAMVVSIVLLIAVLVIGKDVNGARRWIDLGPFDLQPSEVAKLGFMVYLAAWLSRKRPTLKTFKEVFRQHLYSELIPFVALMGVIGVLIILQPDLDTAVIICASALTVYFVSGKDAMHTLGSVFIVLTFLVIAVVAAVAAPYRFERVQTYLSFVTTGDLDPATKKGAGFQMWNGLIAIGSGGVFGVGFGESRQKLFYLQDAAFTDSIFSIIAEEFGLVGSLITIVAFLYFMSLGVQIAQRAPDQFSALLAVGITTWITLQAFLNIGANLAIFPFGGIPLPFISYGGSNTLTILIGVGLLLNISKHCNIKD